MSETWVVGLRYREAAKVLRIPEGTLTTRVFRARQKVAATLERENAGRGKSLSRRCVLTANHTAQLKDLT